MRLPDSTGEYGQLKRPRAIQNTISVPDLGDEMHRYLVVHGYNHVAVNAIAYAAATSSHQVFIQNMKKRGFAEVEAEYMADFIDLPFTAPTYRLYPMF